MQEDTSSKQEGQVTDSATYQHPTAHEATRYETLEQFQQWEMDFHAPIQPHGSYDLPYGMSGLPD